MNLLEGNRKLLLTLVLSVMGGVGLMTGSTTWDQVLDFWKWLAGFYIAGNVGERVANNFAKKEKPE